MSRHGSTSAWVILSRQERILAGMLDNSFRLRYYIYMTLTRISPSTYQYGEVQITKNLPAKKSTYWTVSGSTERFATLKEAKRFAESLAPNNLPTGKGE